MGSLGSQAERELIQHLLFEILSPDMPGIPLHATHELYLWATALYDHLGQKQTQFLLPLKLWLRNWEPAMGLHAPIYNSSPKADSSLNLTTVKHLYQPCLNKQTSIIVCISTVLCQRSHWARHCGSTAYLPSPVMLWHIQSIILARSCKRMYS